MNKVLIVLLSIVLTCSGCGKQNNQSNRDLSSTVQENLFADTASSITSSVVKAPMVENDALISSNLKKALVEDTLFAVKIYVNPPPDADLSANTIETFKHEDALTYLYIIPRYVGSSITLESMDFDESGNEFTTTGLLFESTGTDNYALLVQTDLPEAGPRLRITVTYENRTATYEPTAATSSFITALLRLWRR